MTPVDNVSPVEKVTAFSNAETAAMQAALNAALKGPRGANPLVGAVVIDADGHQL